MLQQVNDPSTAVVANDPCNTATTGLTGQLVPAQLARGRGGKHFLLQCDLCSSQGGGGVTDAVTNALTNKVTGRLTSP